MKKICCIKGNIYRKFKNPKLSYIFEKTLVLSIIWCCSKDKKIFKEEESILGLQNMGEIKTIAFQFNISIFKSFQRPPFPLSSTHQY